MPRNRRGPAVRFPAAQTFHSNASTFFPQFVPSPANSSSSWVQADATPIASHSSTAASASLSITFPPPMPRPATTSPTLGEIYPAPTDRLSPWLDNLIKTPQPPFDVESPARTFRSVSPSPPPAPPLPPSRSLSHSLSQKWFRTPSPTPTTLKEETLSRAVTPYQPRGRELSRPSSELSQRVPSVQPEVTMRPGTPAHMYAPSPMSIRAPTPGAEKSVKTNSVMALPSRSPSRASSRPRSLSRSPSPLLELQHAWPIPSVS